jgi:hypothetical protein
MFVRVHLHAKKSGSTRDSINDRWCIKATSENGPHMRTGSKQKNSYMGRHITHDEIVHIWGLT